MQWRSLVVLTELSERLHRVVKSGFWIFPKSSNIWVCTSMCVWISWMLEQVSWNQELTHKYLASGRFFKGNFWIPVKQCVNVCCGDGRQIMSGGRVFLKYLAKETWCVVGIMRADSQTSCHLSVSIFWAACSCYCGNCWYVFLWAHRSTG